MQLVNLTNDAPRTEPLLRIYGNYMTFNAAASRLLGLTDGDRIYIGRDERACNNLYVGKATLKQSRSVTRRSHSFIVYCAPLARQVAGWLEGQGTYRICPEDTQVDGAGNIYYNIFKRKYGN